MSLAIISAGMQSSIQDLGRTGYRHLGVSQCGVLDPIYARLANRLLGNFDHLGLIEITLGGLIARAQADMVIAIAGIDLIIKLDERLVQACATYAVAAGSRISIQFGATGARAYLAVMGGFQIEPVMESCSTDLQNRFGGWQARALCNGDVIPFQPTSSKIFAQVALTKNWWIDLSEIYLNIGVQPIRFLPGTHWIDITPEQQQNLLQAEFRVGPQSNRMGLRLAGPVIEGGSGDLISEPVNIGTIQLPPNGNLIVLLNDAQTVGGYARIGHVIEADIPRLAQSRAGSGLRFQLVDQACAQMAADKMHQVLYRASLAINERGISCAAVL